MIRRLALLALALACLASSGWAQPPSTSDVTIYSRDLAFVREARVLDFGAGDTARLTGLPERLDVSSLRLVPSGKGRIRRLAYRFDASAGDRWAEQARGRRVRVSLRGERVVEGVLVSADPNWLAIRTDAGQTEIVARAAVDQIRMPDLSGFGLEPALEVVLEGGASRSSAELTYLTGGLSWTAEHVLRRTGEKTAVWSSAFTVANASGRDYDVPRLALVAGDPNRGAPAPMPYARGTMAVEMAQKSDVSEQPFSEYHLYRLDRAVRLRNGETQLFTLLEPRTVSMTPRYLARPGGGVVSQLEIRNDKAAGLGVPLPGGRVRVYESDGPDERFAGEASIAHTPDGEKLTIDVGTAFDLVAERREVSNRMLSEREREYTVEVKLRNRKKAPVTIVVEEPVAPDHEVVKSSHPATSKDANTLQFAVPVPAGKESVLTYTIRVRY